MTEEENVYLEMRQKFQENFQKRIVPVLRQLDDKRKAKLKLARICSILSCVIGILLIIITSEDYKVFAFMLIVFSCFIGNIIKKNFEGEVKEQIMQTVCNCFGKMQWLQTYNGWQKFEASCLFPKYNSTSYDDIFTGKHKDVAYDIVESELSYISGKGDRRRKKVVFKGIIIKFSMNKNFNSHTIITPDTLMHISPSSKLKHTVLEDVIFEKKFDVFTNNEVDARYLITPTFMERLNNMQTAFYATSTSCAFYENSLIVALSTGKDLFSLCSLDTPLDDPQQYFKMFEEILSIIKLIDHFKLDQKIGL